MAQIVTDKKKIENIATAIRNKGGSDEPMLPGDMPTRISDLQVGDVVMNYAVTEKKRQNKTNSVYIETGAESEMTILGMGAYFWGEGNPERRWGYGLTSNNYYPLPESDGYYHYRLPFNESVIDWRTEGVSPPSPDYTAQATDASNGMFADNGWGAEVWYWNDQMGPWPIQIDWSTVEFEQDDTVKPLMYKQRPSSTGTALGGTFYKFRFQMYAPERIVASSTGLFNASHIWVQTTGDQTTYIIGATENNVDGMSQAPMGFNHAGMYSGTGSATGDNYSAYVNVSALDGDSYGTVAKMGVFIDTNVNTDMVGWVWVKNGTSPNFGMTIEEARQKLIADNYRMFAAINWSSIGMGKLVQPKEVRDTVNAIKVKAGLNEIRPITGTMFPSPIPDPNSYEYGVTITYKKQTQYSDYAGAAGVTWYAEDDWEQENPHSCVALYKEGQANPAGTYRESRW